MIKSTFTWQWPLQWRMSVCAHMWQCLGWVVQRSLCKLCYNEVCTESPWNKPTTDRTVWLTSLKSKEYTYSNQCWNDCVNCSSYQMEAVSIIVMCKIVTNKREDGHSIVQQVFLHDTHTWWDAVRNAYYACSQQHRLTNDSNTSVFL